MFDIVRDTPDVLDIHCSVVLMFWTPIIEVAAILACYLVILASLHFWGCFTIMGSSRRADPGMAARQLQYDALNGRELDNVEIYR